MSYAVDYEKMLFGELFLLRSFGVEFMIGDTLSGMHLHAEKEANPQYLGWACCETQAIGATIGVFMHEGMIEGLMSMGKKLHPMEMRWNIFLIKKFVLVTVLRY